MQPLSIDEINRLQATNERRARVLELIEAEASAFIEYDPHTNDAFIRIRGLAKAALAEGDTNDSYDPHPSYTARYEADELGAER